MSNIKDISSKTIQFTKLPFELSEMKTKISRIQGVYHVDILFPTHELIVYMEPEKESYILASIQEISPIKK